MPVLNKRLRVFAGPNGSGKSTIIKEIREKYNCGPYVNADEIQLSFNSNKSIDLFKTYGLSLTQSSFKEYQNNEANSWATKAHSNNLPVHIFFENNFLKIQYESGLYDAAIAADFIRRQLLKGDETFTFETVLSHPSKLDLLQEAEKIGFKNYLYFVCTVDPEINISRVAQRVALGGHHVPEDKIVSRYYASLQLLPLLVPYTHRCFFFDNSTEKGGINLVGEIDEKRNFTTKATQMPWWLNQYVVVPLYQ